jgi:hypothetical protein
MRLLHPKHQGSQRQDVTGHCERSEAISRSKALHCIGYRMKINFIFTQPLSIKTWIPART